MPKHYQRSPSLKTANWGTPMQGACKNRQFQVSENPLSQKPCSNLPFNLADAATSFTSKAAAPHSCQPHKTMIQNVRHPDMF
eukprot:1151628-Pelagomonas_calceolata.AAC.6